MDRKELDEILRLHQLWLTYSPGGKQANLSYADLSSADLRKANLRFANLSEANLEFANLSEANLRDANLSNACLSNAILINACLDNANLSFANLRYAYLSNADLNNANLNNAWVLFADLDNANNVTFPIACPSEGAFVGWKKAVIMNTNQYCVVKLMICDDARRTSSTGRKCRCDKAKVLEIYDMSGNAISANARSMRDASFRYVVGETVTVPNYNECRWNECSEGIHFFITREEAERYNG